MDKTDIADALMVAADELTKADGTVGKLSLVAKYLEGVTEIEGGGETADSLASHMASCLVWKCIADVSRAADAMLAAAGNGGARYGD